MATTSWGFAETYSVLLRRHNEGRVDLPQFLARATALRCEVVHGTKFGLLPIDDATIFASTLVMRRHTLNATDAVLLTMLLDFVTALAPGDAFVLVAADTRLLRAATAEGIAV